MTRIDGSLSVRIVDARLASLSRARKAVVMKDFRSDAEREIDAKLAGTWWRCPVHGLVADPLLVCGLATCSELSCVRDLLVVASGRRIVPEDARFPRARKGRKRNDPRPSNPNE